MVQPHIFTHRGLEPTKAKFYGESTIEAFKDQLQRGFGLEVDLNFTKDGIVLCHDAHVTRMTQGKDKRALRDLTTKQACEVELPNGRLATFEELMNEAAKYPEQMLAIHFKGGYQTPENIKRLIDHLSLYEEQVSQLLLFDATQATAREIKNHFPSLQIAASVSHSYDIERYQAATKGTLISLAELLNSKELYSWAWLDEWDLVDRGVDGKIDPEGKKLYTQEVFALLRSNGFKIALVTPELHGTSPGLLGGEAHADAKTPQTLFVRLAQILSLQPDALCTDFPEEVRAMAHCEVSQ